MPNRLVKNEATATDTYAQFVAEPFDKGYGHTIGNSLRRVLLSSLEGASITSVKIRGVEHEFSTIPGVLEDVVQIVLNLKKIKFRHNSESKEPRLLSLIVEKEGTVTAGFADRLHPGLTPVGTAAGDDHEGAGFGQPFGEGAAENAGAPDDDGRAALEAEEMVEECVAHALPFAAVVATGRRSSSHSVWKVPGLSVRS